MKEESSTKQPLMLSVKSIIIAIIAYVLGIVSVFLVENCFTKEQITWSTDSLLSLVSTIALGAASIVLTWIAYTISRDSEKTLMDLFLKTNETLKNIGTSTGITEKRIEDIKDMISGGGVNLIAAEAIEQSRKEYPIPDERATKLQDEIAKSLRQQLNTIISSSSSETRDILSKMEEKQNKVKEVRSKWIEFRKSVIDNLRKFHDIKIVSEESGDIEAEESSKFWDAILEIGDKHIGIDIHTKAQFDYSFKWKSNQIERNDFLRRLFWRIEQDEFGIVFVICDEDIWQETGIMDVKKSFDEFNKKNEKQQIITLYGNAESLAEQIHSICIGK